jgi:branched-chain amino acid aminotransferase
MFYLNGNYFTDQSNVINIADRGFLLGDGVFTTIRVHNNVLMHFDEHIERLTNNAAKIYLKVKLDMREIKEICFKLLKSNNLDGTTAIVRITLTRGCSGRGINIPDEANPTLLIKAVEYHDNSAIFPRICTTTIRRNENSILSNIKSLNYLEPILARHEALSKGYDDGVMLNTKNAITECSVANIFFITHNDEVITPSISEGVLPGIMRSQVIKICNELNIPIFEKSIYSNDIANYRASFITNCAIGLKAVKSFDDILLDCQDKLTKKLVKAYTDLSINCNG